MKKIPLSGDKGKGKFVIIDDDKYEELYQYKYYFMNNGYAVRGIYIGNQKNRLRLIQHDVLSVIKGREVDHINGDKLDNRRKNLRYCNRVQNSVNMGKPANNTSGYKGVYFFKRVSKWVANIRSVNFNNGRTKNLGYYATAEEAARVYDKKAKELWGDFARLNFPES